MALALDHLFVFIQANGPEPARLGELGLIESYRRDHPGQGTSNICYCFDNAFLELLWLRDLAEATAPAIARTRLAERSRWRENGTSPFGLALRRSEQGAALPFPTWGYSPPYLPEGVSIPVAEVSDDPVQPFIFESLGGARPDQWTNGRAGARQSAAGLGEIAAVELRSPTGAKPVPELLTIAESGWLTLGQGDDCAGVTLTISKGMETPLRLLLPDCILL